eukprot:1161662-Pelagomonas_calceolata.AAC.6
MQMSSEFPDQNKGASMQSIATESRHAHTKAPGVFTTHVYVCSRACMQRRAVQQGRKQQRMSLFLGKCSLKWKACALQP